MVQNIKKLFFKEFNRYIAVGISTVLIDICIYLILINIGLRLFLAKSLSFLAGTIYSYFINKKWTFKITGSKKKFFLYISVYLFSMKINTFTNSFIINIFIMRNNFSIFIAFITSTIASATFNYLLIKNFIFKKNLKDISN